MLCLTGGTGTLGRAIKKVASKRGIPFLAPLTPSSISLILINVINFCSTITPEDTIVHCAAITNWEACHENFLQCFHVNSLGAWNVAKVAKNHGALLIYLSTDAVFDGITRERGFTEEDIPHNPSSVYGISKLAGENLVKETACKLLVLRIGWFFGDHPSQEKKFVGSVLRQAAQGMEVKVVDDKVGTMAYVPHVADKICNYVLVQQDGIRHLAHRGIVSRYEVAEEIFRIWGFAGSIQRISSKEFPTHVKRPDFSALESIHEDAQMSTWQEALEEYHHRYPCV